MDSCTQKNYLGLTPADAEVQSCKSTHGHRPQSILCLIQDRCDGAMYEGFCL